MRFNRSRISLVVAALIVAFTVSPAAAQTTEKKPYSPYVGRDFPTNVYFGDLGGLFVGGGVSFRAASWVDLALVYRHLEWDLGSDPLVADINFNGPAFGAIFRF